MPQFFTRRRLQFSLRTLFVVVTLLCVWLAWEVNWIRQRHALLASHKVFLFDELVGPTPKDTPPPAPGMLWLFGETGVQNMVVWTVDRSDAGLPLDSDLEAFRMSDEYRLAGRLFPEAHLILWRKTINDDPPRPNPRR